MICVAFSNPSSIQWTRVQRLMSKRSAACSTVWICASWSLARVRPGILCPFDAGDALLDSDLDGFTNLAEFEDGTKAGDPRSNARASRIRLYFRVIESAL